MLVLLGLISGCTSTADLAPLDIAPPAQQVPGKSAALVVDGNNGAILFQTNADAHRYPASLTKMMTIYLLFEALQAGRISQSTLIPVSAHAASQPPTKIGFRPGDTIDVDSAIKALVTKSANDVAVAVGEFLGGTQDQFAQMMTAKARQLGMRNTVFRNASGLPDKDQQTTARDMAVLGIALRQRFPAQYFYFSIQSFSYRGRLIRGHNDLLSRVPGVDGIKTGYIRASGFNIVTSVSSGGRKLVVVVFGGDSARGRNQQVQDLIERYLPLAKLGGS